MWKTGIFDSEDINETLLSEIAFFNIFYPGMGEAGCVIFLTQRGDEYIISQRGTDWTIYEIVQLFPELYEVYQNRENGKKDEYGFTVVGNWKIIPKCAGEFFVRTDWFEKFYEKYQTKSELNKKFPFDTARLLFGRGRRAIEQRMVYKKTQECWDKEEQERIAREREREKNRLSDADVPWMKFKSDAQEAHIKFWVRKDDDGTLSGYRWFIEEQKEQHEEGYYESDAPTECYNLFLQRYRTMNVEIFDDFEEFYDSYVTYNEKGEFVRSYKDLETAKEAVTIRNEWIGWGDVNKKNLYPLDYNHLKTYFEGDSKFIYFL